MQSAKKPYKPQIMPVQPNRKKAGLLKRLLPISIFISIILILLFLVYWYNFMPRAIGRSYNVRYEISSKRRALIREVTVAIGDHVTEEQLIVVLDINELEAQKKRFESALIVAKEQIVAKQNELQLKQQELRLRLGDQQIFRTVEVESARVAVSEDAARLQSAIARLQGTEIELERVSKLSISGSVSQSTVDKQQTLYNAIDQEVKGYDKVVNSGQERLKQAMRRLSDYEKEKEINVLVEEILRPVRAYVNEVKMKIEEIDALIQNSKLVSPVDGLVESINKRPGAGIEAAEPIVTIEVANPKLVEVYIREKWLNSIKVGEYVTLRPVADGGVSSFKGKIIERAQMLTPIPRDFLPVYEELRVVGLRFIVEIEKPWSGPHGAAFYITF